MTPVREALKEAIDVLEGMNDDEINLELIPRLKDSLSAAPGEPCAWMKAAPQGDTLAFVPASEDDDGAFPVYTTPQPAAGWDERDLDVATAAYNAVWQQAEGIEASNVDEVRRDAVRAALEALRREAPAPAEGHAATVIYTNYRGETSERQIIPRSVRFSSTKWHPEPQWLLVAYDCDKRAEREFALKDFGARPDTAEALPRWRHKKRGTTYTVIGQAQVQCDDGLTDYEIVTVYRGDDGDLWVRRKPEFEDRFEALSPPSGGDEAKESEGAKLLPCPVCGGEAIHAIETLKRTIIKPDPSEPDRREIVARNDPRNRTERLLNAAMDHIAGTLEQPTDPRAWGHLLIYCPAEIVAARAAKNGRNAIMKPGDLLKCEDHIWRVRGIHLGALDVESIVEIENVSHKPGWTGEWETHQLMFVPEILLRSCAVIEQSAALDGGR